MRISEQPGRLCAVVVISPLLLASSVWLRYDPVAAAGPVSIGVAFFAVVLFSYDLFWILFREAAYSDYPRVSYKAGFMDNDCDSENDTNILNLDTTDDKNITTHDAIKQQLPLL